MAGLFDPFELKSLKLKNRIVMPPMCQYCATGGVPDDWHYVHYTSRAIGGTGLIIIEMTNVEPDGRITDNCLGLWSDEYIPHFERIIRSCQSYGAKVAIQIAHAGRKAKDAAVPVSSTAKRHSDKLREPRPLSTDEVKQMVGKFRDSFRRAIAAGVDAIEIHGAHGYLIHQFHSPYINDRSDEYGRDLALFGTEVIQAARDVMPDDMPLIMRVSGREYVEDGYGLDHIIRIAERYRDAGADLFHITSGGEGASLRGIFDSGKQGYQVHLAEAIKQALNVPVIAVGGITDPKYADSVIREGRADLVGVGRELLRNPYWPVQAGLELGQTWVPQPYEMAYGINMR